MIVDNDPNIVQKQPSVKDSHLISTQQISLLAIKYKTEWKDSNKQQLKATAVKAWRLKGTNAAFGDVCGF